MHYFVRRPWDLPQHLHTEKNVFDDRRRHRRDFLKAVYGGMGGIALGSLLSGCEGPSLDELQVAGASEVDASLFPAARNADFEYGRDETDRREAAQFTNFYEFSGSKSVYKYIDSFQPLPWSVEVTGLCAKPQKFDLDDLLKLADLEERAYRHRCVETWAMTVPWTGYPLRSLLEKVEPSPKARFVRFETFNRPQEATRMRSSSFPWPYNEGLTIAEAMNELAFLTFGIYGEPLLKQHGAPVRLVLPWKYGFKSIKSIVKIELTDEQPATFWNTVNPHEYKFEANVDPAVPHPRWSQEREWMLGTKERFDTQPYNGYGDWVAKLYS
ncbi:MAG: protein-methionine-sulfoxide reductase catalytic subunit MsrP [Planctomycetaceae bacterium]|nr:protein-methionine-sulfoxide reductase catalytic subunit MsrP [Planctomycetaceae bacterium]